MLHTHMSTELHNTKNYEFLIILDLYVISLIDRIPELELVNAVQFNNRDIGPM